MIVADDMRADDVWVMPNLIDWLGAGFVGLRHYGDTPVCTPTRGSILTGLQGSNHRLSQSDPSTYYRYAVQGFDGVGPWERVTGDPANSGDLFALAREAGWLTFMAGKLTHGYGRATTVLGTNYGLKNSAGDPLGPNDFPWSVKRIPPNIDCAHLRCGPASAQPGSTANWGGGDPNPYDSWWSEKLEDDTTTDGGEGVGTPVLTKYQRDVALGTISGSTATLLLTEEHGLEDGDLVVVTSTNPAGYRTGTTEVPVTVIDDVTFSYQVTGAPPSTSTTTGRVYISKNFGTTYMMTKLLEFMGRRSDEESFFAILTPNACHSAGTARPHKALEGQVVDKNEFTTHVQSWIDAGVIDPTNSKFNTAKNHWQQRMESLRQLDNEIGRLRTYLEGRGWDEKVVVIFTADQGAHYGEYNIYTLNDGSYFAKNTPFDAAACPPMYVLNMPDLPHGMELERITSHVDWLPTLARHFGVNATEMDRDGVDLVEIVKSDAYPDRAFRLNNAMPTASGPDTDGLVTGGGIKWIDGRPTATQDPWLHVDMVFDIVNDPEESNNLAASDPGEWDSGKLAALAARAAALKAARGEEYRTT